jgi:DNA-binding IscR family transcriptional regulator
MFRELKLLEYTLEITRAMSTVQGIQGSKEIYSLVAKRENIKASLSYVQKLLPKMVKAGILISSDTGYELAKPIDEITVASILDICDMPAKDSLIFPLCTQIKQAFSLTTVDELSENF